MSAMSLALDIIGMDLTAGAFASVLGRLSGLDAAAAGTGGNAQLAQMANNLKLIEGAAAGAGIAFLAFKTGLQYAIDAGAALQQAGVMASIAISDGSQHVGELEQAIVQLANTSQYKIADVDMAFRVLGGLGFTTGQILGGLGQQAIILAQAMGGPGAGVSAADAAQLLGQAIYIFGQKGLTAQHAADVLTGAFYNNMMSVSDLTQYLGMAGGTAAALGVSFDQLMTFGSLLTPMFGSASSAGASLSYMMRNLAHPATSAMADEIRHLGLQIYDANGNFVGLKSIMDQLFEKTSTMTQQQKMDVFGTLFNVRSGRAAMDLMNQTQSSFDAEYARIDSRLTQTGQAQRDSTAINNTAIGAWNRLTTTVNDFFAVAGKTINQALIPFYNWLNSIFSALQNNAGFEQFLAILLPVGTALSGIALAGAAVTGAIMLLGPVLGMAALFLAGIVFTAGLVAGAIYLMSSKANDFKGNLAFLNPIVDTFRNLLGFLIDDIKKQDWGPLLTVVKALGIALAVVAAVLVGALLAGLIAVAAAVLAVVDTVGQFSSWVGKMLGYIHELANVFGDVAILIKDVFTGNWKALAGDVERIQVDWNSDMQQLANQQAVDAKKAADQQTADATAAALKKQADVYNATAAGDEKSRAQAQAQADYYQNLANTTKDKALVTQYQQQAAMYQAQANGYANDEAQAKQNAANLIAQANNVKQQLITAENQTTQGVVAGARDMSSKTTAQAHDMAVQSKAYFDTMEADGLNDAKALSNGVSSTMQTAASLASTWGNDMANNFANGFSIGASSAETAAQRMAAKMAATLGHSKPTEGPLVDDDVWGLHMAQNFAAGLLQGVGLIGGVATQVAQAAAGSLSGLAPIGGGTVPTPGLLVGGVGGGGQNIILPIYIGQDLVAQYGYNTITQQLTMQGIGRQFR